MDDSLTLWRYMGFSRFVWLLQTKQLWLARVDTFPDPWEVSLTHGQVEFLRKRHPIRTLGSTEPETFEERTARVQSLWWIDTYVNCWTASPYESHALWRIFCGPNEGVAIRTTLGRLRQIMGNIGIYKVEYGEPANTHTPQQIAQATVKRPAFAYEQEVRIIATRDTPNPNLNKGEFGFEYPIDFDIIEQIVVHPEADESFKLTVASTVDDYAKALRGRVYWSSMRELPPFRAKK